MCCKKCKVCEKIDSKQIKISINGVVQNLNEQGIIDIKIPIKTSQLINDSGFSVKNNNTERM